MRRIWIWNDLFVDPANRRAGVGGALMARAETFAREAGAKRLALATQRTNAQAQALYQARAGSATAFDHYSLGFEGAVELRVFEDADEDAVVALWQRCHLTRAWNDRARTSPASAPCSESSSWSASSTGRSSPA